MEAELREKETGLQNLKVDFPYLISAYKSVSTALGG